VSVCVCDNFDFYKYFDLFFVLCCSGAVAGTFAVAAAVGVSVTKHHSTCAMIDDATQRQLVLNFQYRAATRCVSTLT